MSETIQRHRLYRGRVRPHDEGEWIRFDDLADLRHQLAAASETIDRLQEYGIDTKSYGDGDTNALWNRVDAFRNDPEAVLVPADVRELAEWWAELHTTLCDLDEKFCKASSQAAAANAIIEKVLPKNWGDNTDAAKAVRDILAYWLKANGYDGLCNSDMECGCSIDDLIPCDAPCDKCEAAYQGPSPDSSVDFFMYPTRAAAEAARGEK